MDFRFNHLASLHWLWLVAAAAVLMALGLAARQRALRRFAAVALLQYLIPTASLARKIVRAVLLTIAMIALVAAMIDPRWGVRYEDVQRRGVDMLFVVDVSRSMLAEDVKPNRLDRAKQMIGDVVEELAGDRVGLISFAGVAAVKCPLTVDYGAFRLSLNDLSTESAAKGGSLLGDALRLAGESFTDDEVKEFKSVIVLSDGEDQGSYPAEAAKKLFEEHGVRVYTIGIGDPREGARIPLEQNRRKVYLTHDGQEVWSKMNSAVLQEIALNAGGAYIPAETSAVDLADAYHQFIAPAESREFETSRIKVYDPQYQWFAGLALGLLLVEMWMSERKPIRRKVMNNGEVMA